MESCNGKSHCPSCGIDTSCCIAIYKIVRQNTKAMGTMDSPGSILNNVPIPLNSFPYGIQYSLESNPQVNKLTGGRSVIISHYHVYTAVQVVRRIYVYRHLRYQESRTKGGYREAITYLERYNTPSLFVQMTPDDYQHSWFEGPR
jgi:hypothetical protein